MSVLGTLVQTAKAKPLEALGAVGSVASAGAMALPFVTKTKDQKAQEAMAQEESGTVPPYVSKGASVTTGAVSTQAAVPQVSPGKPPVMRKKQASWSDVAKNVAEKTTLYGTPLVIGWDLSSRVNALRKRPENERVASIIPSLAAVKQIPSDALQILGARTMREMQPEDTDPIPRPTERPSV
jgi:hypothetical protein